jgi:dihydroxyacetone kinase
MMARCGAKPGEKTIVDSLAAGVAELQARSGEDAAAAFAAAAQAAETGSEATRGMRAVHGRAAYYGDKSLGVLDGGSVVGALVFRAVAEAIGG